MAKQTEAAYEIAYKGDGTYTLTSKGEHIMDGTFGECVTEYEKHFEGGK